MDERFLAQIESCWLTLVSGLSEVAPFREGRIDFEGNATEDVPYSLPMGIVGAARRAIEQMAFVQMCRQRGVEPEGAGDLPPTPIAESLRGSLEARLASIEAGGSQTWPVEALGWIHQHLMGRRVLRGRDGRLKAGAEPHSRKSAGIVYTPTYVCQYIAEIALRARLSHNLPDRNAGLRLAVLDPACGGGAFLLAAFRHLRAWCRQQNLSLGPKDLAGSLHGVDIDPEAVQVARRSLWLEAQTGRPLAASSSRDLAAMLAARVRSGDVLCDRLFQPDERFDVVLGNPPYRRERHTKQLLERIAATPFGRRYRTPRMDLWYYFFHRSLELLNPGGRLSFIVSSYWTSGRGAAKLIKALRQSTHVEEVFSLGRLRVFPGVAGQHMILTVVREPSSRPTIVKAVGTKARGDAEPYVRGLAPVAVYPKTAEQLFHDGAVDLEEPCDEVLARLARETPLGALGIIRQGIAENPASVTRRANEAHGGRWRVGEGVFVLTREELARLNLPDHEAALVRPYHRLRDVGRYALAPEPSRWLLYTTAETCPDIDQYPVLRSHLERFRVLLEARRETRLGRRPWWQLHWPRDERLWQAPKVIAVQMGPRPATVPAAEPVYVPFAANVFLPRPGVREHLHYVAAVLNSRLLWQWFRHQAKQRGAGLEINGHVLARCPIRTIDFSRPSEAARHDRLVELVDAMLPLHRRLHAGAPPAEAAELGRQADLIDAEIDRLVEELYAIA